VSDYHLSSKKKTCSLVPHGCTSSTCEIGVINILKMGCGYADFRLPVRNKPI